MSSPLSSYWRKLCALCVLGPRKTDLVAIGEPAALQSRVVQTVVAIERQKVTFRDIAARIHAVMQRRGKTAHVDLRAFFHDLFHRRLLPGHDYGLHALLHALV